MCSSMEKQKESLNYIDRKLAKQMINNEKTALGKRKVQAAIVNQNCLTRYRGLAHNKDKVIEAFREDKLYFSTALGFNDPYDTLMYVDYDRLTDHIRLCWRENMPQYVESIKKKNQYLGYLSEYIVSNQNPYKEEFEKEFFTQLSKIIEKLKQNLYANIKGICFSEDSRSMLMWSHYASNHTGIALLYDKQELLNAKCYNRDGEELKEKFTLEKIKYGTERVDATGFINDYILKYHKMAPEFAYDVFNLPYPSKKVLKEIILSKYNVWAYEKEVRLIPRSLEFEKENNICYLSIRPKAVMLGSKINDRDKEEIVKIAKKKKIIIYEAWLNEKQRDYNVVFQKYGL